MADKNYALEWHKYGLEHDDDAIVKFMMHWVAFNWLYSAYFYKTYPGEKKYDREKIQAFCNANYEKLVGFDAFDRDEIAVFMEEPVCSATSGCAGRRQRDLFSDLKDSKKDSEKKIESLLLTIYQVRCNLFHGSKSLEKKRDIDLVRASSVLLEGYLKTVI